MKERLKALLADKAMVALLAMSVFSLLITCARIAYTEKSHFVFLTWNLFLGFIPLFIASIMYYGRIRNKVVCLIFGFIWLVFFPNAPYLLTDFIHLGYGTSVPVWLDMILILNYGFTGLYYGFQSLWMIEQILEEVFHLKRTWTLAVILLFLSSFGVYLGRFLRWNSWDILGHLDNIFVDILEVFVRPYSNRSAWVFTLLFGILLNLLYVVFKISGATKSTGPLKSEKEE